MRKLFVIPALFLLSACSTVTPSLVETKLQVVTPDPSMYNCPSPGKLPNSETLTDVEVSRLVTKLYKNNKTCVNSMSSIQQYLDNAKKQIESK